MIDFIVFAVLPYVALAIAIVGLIWRYRTDQFSFSSVSSQFLENRKLFWGSVPWHYGIILILLGHLFGVLFPSGVMAFNGVPVRLYVLEVTGLALGLLVLVGLVFLLLRRGTDERIRSVTTRMDLLLLLLLLLSIITGLGTAIFYRWGSGWYVQTATPYLRSLFTLSPAVGYMASMPLLVKIHAVNASVILAVFPFTRLVHMLSVPLAYLWRPYQIVLWGRRRIRQ
ncbi:MAG: respiratory nitrate reductase subunit gamma [Dehalococcoidales bacterium]|nr:respiratory nitrate reductase subunit gamma [Dehalococcoidales bacterium]MDP6126794.1 respiratory nitrate reductase subunit gamma [Dehalococcoidales bacterium]MDP6632469.1 respiratory nitrate reductase subunit gamma [Dehalococcoidales bacterium]MDP7525246.1 respiratory nitrate reductase subunit gamma [Dehalococcoidales bacterium]